jgi:hypothetical protein
MALQVLYVLSVKNRRRIGTIELSDNGELHAAPRGVQGLVEGMAKNYGWDSRETFKNLKNYSNGYLQIVPPLSIARVFDGLVPDTDEPQFAAEHPVIADLGERRRLSDYLKAGRPFYSTTARDLDRVDRTRGKVVPLSFRTDGTWVWTDSVTYYLEIYGFQPDADLVAHIVANGHQCPNVSDGMAQRALNELSLAPADREAPPPNAEGGDSPAFTGSGDRPPPSIPLETAGGSINVASNLSAEEYRILERMRRELDDPPGEG